MKNILIFALPLFLLTACNQAELDQLKSDKDSLMSVLDERDVSLNEFIVTFNDVERNLDSVAVRQQIIITGTEQTGEMKKSQTTRINEEIFAINMLMDQNRKKIDELNRKLKNSSRKNIALEKAIVTLNNQLVQKDIELAALNEKLNNMNVEVTLLQTMVNSLTEVNNSQAQAISDGNTALHTAYYVVGKSKDLQESNLIDRKGGLLGMGKTSKMNSDFDNSKFTKIDYTQVSSIAVNSKDARIITTHPGDSYILENDPDDKKLTTQILITNPEKFWSVSKYLVVIKN